VAVALSPSPRCRDWPSGKEDGGVDGQSWSRSRACLQPQGRAAHAAASAVVWDWHPCLETQDSQLCGEE